MEDPEKATPLGRLVWFFSAVTAWWVVITAARLHADPRGFGTHQQLGLPPCAFTPATGIPCPGCGLTTSFTHMAHGHVFSAFQAHLMGPLLFLSTVFVAIYAPYALIRGKSLTSFLDSRGVLPVLVATASAGIATFILRVVHILATPV